ncbi:MAG: hypothetical protein UHS55_06250, partial [Prevotella sp.]|nr:hypothetical protein [Prevotella sp.]
MVILLLWLWSYGVAGYGDCPVMRAIPWVKPKSVIRPQYSKTLAIALFPNIFYFLVGILPIFV